MRREIVEFEPFQDLRGAVGAVGECPAFTAPGEAGTSCMAPAWRRSAGETVEGGDFKQVRVRPASCGDQP